MAVNYEIKGQLARLLATEDLIVEHRKVSTACFNVHTRVLTLPLWERASNAVYDMLVAHEVGHALYTPDKDWIKEIKVPPSYVNIVEDVRIEKLMKRRYGGLSKCMYKGYKELYDDDFFSIGDEDYNQYSLADRVNLYYKIGNFLNVQFKEHEQNVVEIIAECETFGDVLLAAEELYRISKMQNDESEDTVTVTITLENQQTSSGMSGDNVEINPEQSIEGGVQSQEKNEDESQKEDDNTESTHKLPSPGHHGEPEIKTDERLMEAISQLANLDEDAFDNVYVELPTLDLDVVIAKNSEIHSYLETYWNYDHDRFSRIDDDYKKFKTESQREVNYLVKEFECKKSADNYSRALTSRTGVLDCSKLHSYKYTEDLFKKVTTIPDGKNHGLIFILDWSGSMDRVLLDTVKQLYNLIWFCKKVCIPFEVYAFTNEWKCVTYDYDGNAIFPKKNQKKIAGQIQISEDFSLMNFFSSKTKSVDLDRQMKYIYRIAKAFSSGWKYNFNYDIPKRLSLSGTPLNESLIALDQIIPMFKNQNKIQKVHTIVLTDGEACSLNYFTECENYRYNGTPYMGTRHFHLGTCSLRDKKTGSILKANTSMDHFTAFTDLILRYLRNKYSDISFVGMRILSSGEAHSFMRRYLFDNESELEKTQNDWKKMKSFSIKTEGYHKYFGMASNSLSTNTQFVVDENASKIEIRNAFKKYMKSKKVNKKILSEFIQLIA